jgi:tetratricopeptide (TPR) repeat protein
MVMGLPADSANEPTLRYGQEATGPSERVPSDLGRYTLVELLGRGGMGEVWKAWEKGLRRHVAIKFLRGSDAEDLKRFEREAQMVARLNHPNIAPVYEVGAHQEQHYLAMQLIEGVTLDRAKLSHRALLEAIRDAASALDHAHRQGVVHRDVKPGNLMWDTQQVWLMDFGLARQARVESSVSHSGAILGTPQYMSPEQARGESTGIDGRSDVYSLGATLYALLVGRPPFDLQPGQDLVSVLLRVAQEDPPPLRKIDPSIPWELETIVIRAMEKSPDRRYPSAGALAEDLQRFLDGEAIRATRPKLTYRMRKKISKHRWVAAMAAVTGLVLAGGAVALVLGAGRRAAEREEARRNLDLAERVKNPEEKIRLYERAAGHFPEAAEKARQLQEKGVRDRAALSAARAHFDRGRDLFRLLDRLLSTPHWKTGEARTAAQEAVAAFEKALEVYPEYGEAALEIARVELEMDRTREALPWCTRAVEASPELATAYLLRAQVMLEEYEELRHAETGETRPETPEARALEAKILSDLNQAMRWKRDSADLELARGILEFSNGNFAEAARRIELYLARVPGDWRAEEWCAHAHYHARNPAAAVRHARQASAIRPRRITARLFEGLGLRAQGDTAGAMAAYTAAIGINPRTELPYLHRAAVRLETGDVPGALADYDAALKNKISEHGHKKRAYARLKAADYRGAREDAEAALRLKPDDPEALWLRAKAREETGHIAEGLADLDRAVERNPKDGSAYLRRALMRHRAGDRKGALADLDRAIEVDPSLPEPYYNRGVLLREAGDAEGALRDYDRAIELSPGYAAALTNRANIRRDRGDPRGAREDLDRAIQSDPRHIVAYRNRGSLSLAERDPRSALADYGRAIELDPRDARNFEGRAMARSALGEHSAAIEDFGRALALAPRAESYYFRGNARREAGDRQGAIEDYTRALELEPRYLEALNNRGIVKKSLNDLEGATADFERVMELQPKFAKAWLNRGLVRKAQRDYHAALKDVDRAIELDGTYALAYYHRGLIREILSIETPDLLRAAASDLEQAIDLGGPSWSYRASAEQRLEKIRLKFQY